MLSVREAEDFANAFNERQLSRATARFDKLLRIGLDKDEAFVAAVSAEIIAIARTLREPTHERRMTVNGARGGRRP